MPARKQSQAPQAPAQSLADRAYAVKASKPKPVFVDVPGIDRVALADGRVGCVQAQLTIGADGSSHEYGPWQLAIPRKNADGSESAQRFPLADIKLLADAFAAAGAPLV